MTVSCSFCGLPHDTPEQVKRHKKFMNRFYPEIHYYPEVEEKELEK